MKWTLLLMLLGLSAMSSASEKHSAAHSVAHPAARPAITKGPSMHRYASKHGHAHSEPHRRQKKSNRLEKILQQGSGNLNAITKNPIKDPRITSTVTFSASAAPKKDAKEQNEDMGNILMGLKDDIRTPASNAAPTSAGCAPRYDNAEGNTVSGTGRLPKPTSFVKTFGTAYTVDNKLFRIVGPNMYWLCNDENIKGEPKGTYTSKTRIREALAIAVAMGANTIRITSCGVSVGLPFSIEPRLGEFQDPNSIQWDNHDYVIYAAGQYGLRVILPLTDQYDYYHGGLGTYARMNNVSATQYEQLWHAGNEITQNYLQYISVFVPHVNRYNGLRYADDPTILGWETGNELGGYYLRWGFPSVDWTNQIVQEIRKYDKNHIIIDGGFGLIDNYRNTLAPGLTNGNVQSLTDHFYPRNMTRLALNAIASTTFQKPWFIGEYDWTASTNQGASLTDFLNFIDLDLVLGDMIWNVMGHDDQCCAFVQHNDDYEAYYPNGNSDDNQANLLTVVQRWHVLTGRLPPLSLPAVACPQPEF